METEVEEPCCPRCGIQLLIGARFCYLCGASRKPQATPLPQKPLAAGDLLDLSLVRNRLGLSRPALLFFLLGVSCMIAAVVIGLLYKADTLEEWNAIQIWRIEWLLGSCASMLAAILLRVCKKDS